MYPRGRGRQQNLGTWERADMQDKLAVAVSDWLTAQRTLREHLCCSFILCPLLLLFALHLPRHRPECKLHS